MIGTDIQIILPELLLAVFAMAALLFGVYTSQDKAARVALVDRANATRPWTMT